MDSLLFKSLFQASPSTLATYVANISLSQNLEQLRAFIAFVNEISDVAEGEHAQGIFDGKGSLECRRLAQFFSWTQLSSIDDPNKRRATQLSMIKTHGSGTLVTDLRCPPVEALASAFAPACEGTVMSRAESCTASPLGSPEFELLCASAASLKRLQGIAMSSKGAAELSSRSRPFEHFVAHCFASVRCTSSLTMLLGMRPDLSWYHKMDFRCHGHDARSMTEIPAIIQSVSQVNPVSTLALLRHAADLQDEAIDRNVLKVMKLPSDGVADNFQSVYNKHLIDEAWRSHEHGAEPSVATMLKRLFQPVFLANETLAHELYRAMLMNALEKNLSTQPNLKKNGNNLELVIDSLWSLRPSNFVEYLSLNPASKHRDALIDKAAQACRVEILEAFKPFVMEMAEVFRSQKTASTPSPTNPSSTESTPSPPSSCVPFGWGRSEQIDLAYLSASGFGVYNSNVLVSRFSQTVKFLMACGWGYASSMTSSKPDALPLLHLLAKNERRDAVEGMLVLVEAGCDPKQKNSRGRTPATSLPVTYRPAWQDALLSLDAKAAAKDAIHLALSRPTA